MKIKGTVAALKEEANRGGFGQVEIRTEYDGGGGWTINYKVEIYGPMEEIRAFRLGQTVTVTVEAK